MTDQPVPPQLKPKTVVNVEEVRQLKARLGEINRIPFDDIEWHEGGKPIEISADTRREFKFTGLSNATFGEIAAVPPDEAHGPDDFVSLGFMRFFASFNRKQMKKKNRDTKTDEPLADFVSVARLRIRRPATMAHHGRSDSEDDHATNHAMHFASLLAQLAATSLPACGGR